MGTEIGMIVLDKDIIIGDKEVHQEMITKRKEGDKDHSLTLAIIIISKEAEVAQERRDIMLTVMNRDKGRR